MLQISMRRLFLAIACFAACIACTKYLFDNPDESGRGFVAFWIAVTTAGAGVGAVFRRVTLCLYIAWAAGLIWLFASFWYYARALLN